MLMVIPLEAAVQSLLRSLSSVLGGTSTGYAIVAPAVSIRYVIMPRICLKLVLPVLLMSQSLLYLSDSQ